MNWNEQTDFKKYSDFGDSLHKFLQISPQTTQNYNTLELLAVRKRLAPRLTLCSPEGCGCILEIVADVAGSSSIQLTRRG